jgi:tetratricopeptide (TPR) repeat protein
LDAVLEHQQGKAVDLRRLGAEVSWLREVRQEAPLSPVLELAWLTAQLELSNHRGDTETALEARLEELSQRLVDEEPTLVCQADLNRAVRQTNAFRFAEAAKRLARWERSTPREPGLRHWGRLLSQRGQLAAFEGRAAEAIDLFTRALEAFGRLSDPAVRAGEVAQTSVYLATVTMDSDAPLEVVRQRVEAVTSLTPEAIAALAADASPARKYAHHLLLRYLVSRGSEAERAAYLSRRDDWDSDFGHPWPLIVAYRAMLTWPTDAAAGRRLFERAVQGTEGQGSTLQRIGDAIAAELVAWQDGARQMSRLQELLPFNFR